MNCSPYLLHLQRLRFSGTAVWVSNYACLLTRVSLRFLVFPKHLANTRLSDSLNNRSSLTVAGPYRLLTCFHLSFIMR